MAVRYPAVEKPDDGMREDKLYLLFLSIINDGFCYRHMKNMNPFTVNKLSPEIVSFLTTVGEKKEVRHSLTCNDIDNLAKMLYKHYVEDFAEAFKIKVRTEIKSVADTIIESCDCYRIIKDIYERKLYKVTHKIINGMLDRLILEANVEFKYNRGSKEGHSLTSLLYSFYKDKFGEKEEVTDILKDDIPRDYVAEMHPDYKTNPCAEIVLNGLKFCSIKELVDEIPSTPSTLKEIINKYSENEMNNVPYKTVNYVFGQDVNTMTEQNFLAAIRKIEDQISDLKSINVKSSKLKSKIEVLVNQRDTVVDAYDAS